MTIGEPPVHERCQESIQKNMNRFVEIKFFFFGIAQTTVNHPTIARVGWVQRAKGVFYSESDHEELRTTGERKSRLEAGLRGADGWTHDYGCLYKL